MATFIVPAGGKIWLTDRAEPAVKPPYFMPPGQDSTGFLADDSDSTYVVLNLFEHPDGSLADSLDVRLLPTEVPPLLDQIEQFVVRVRLATIIPDTSAEWPGMATPSATVRVGSASGIVVLAGAPRSVIPRPIGPTWFDFPLNPPNAQEGQRLLNFLNAGSNEIYLRLGAPVLRTLDRKPQMAIMEAMLIIRGQLTGAAPPCRQFPRDDEFMLGGARQFPPPKSRQFSVRQHGYY